jgi:transposase-like protein
MDEAEANGLASMSFPADHWPKIHSTNGLERLNGEVNRRTEVVGIFSNDDAITGLVGAIPLEQNDEWAVQRTLLRLAPKDSQSSLPDKADLSLSAASLALRQCGAIVSARS